VFTRSEGCTRHNRVENRSTRQSGYTYMRFSGPLTFSFTLTMALAQPGREHVRARGRASAYLLTHAGHASLARIRARVRTDVSTPILSSRYSQFRQRLREKEQMSFFRERNGVGTMRRKNEARNKEKLQGYNPHALAALYLYSRLIAMSKCHFNGGISSSDPFLSPPHPTP